MNPILSLATQPWAQSLGWTLLHFLWQGAALGFLAWMMLLLLQSSSAKARYGAACGFLVLMVAAPLATFLLLQPQSTPPVLLSLSVATTTAPAAAPLAQRLKASLDPSLPWLLLAWSAGVLLLSLRFLGSWLVVQRLRRRSATPVPSEWHLVLSRLCRELKHSRTVRMLQSAAVEVPMALGWLRPIILVPACAFSGLAPLQLEAILAHELAHIHRGDFLVNLLQSLVEVLLFYHPAVWWLSSRIRAERELCCDDVAASLCGDPLLLARALTELEALRPVPIPSHRLALAATGGSLMHRIRHLLHPARPVSSGARGTALALLAASLLGAAGLVLQEKGGEAPKPGRTMRMNVSDGERKLDVRMKGEVTLNGEAPDLVVVPGEGSFRAEEILGGKTRSFEVTKAKVTYQVNGKVVPLDREGRDWLRSVVRDIKKNQAGQPQVKEVQVHRLEGGGDREDIHVIVNGYEGAMNPEDHAKLKAELAKAVAEGKKARSEGDRARIEAKAIKSDPELKALLETAKKEGKKVRVQVIHKNGEPSNGEAMVIETGDQPKDGEKGIHIRIPRVQVETRILHGSEDPKAEMAKLHAELRALQTRLDHLQKQMALPALAPLTPGSKEKTPPPPPMPPPPPPAPPAPSH